ncbi:hypothetical protein, unlikely [Trypanosoma brucei gambiense DAL972]|uniref:Uncharacterized protein n=1 Tax=Trypanosoma brucei gambiense (strain MHOM/CI/86/DAL972) TaxID=679716 RepID=C9ZM17_TRYB9|nr:hypothetical protein, unlikely [Trypanosoma brucei gambiense DAL972]CBH10442.1 hypothetical protein, unlikely [Trypanosoma brucei gambiense DAL972]|eukprot:XP_011772732.1 hypothetical protein, unlikely [Trypanosoma brucei gambiense DAL972]
MKGICGLTPFVRGAKCDVCTTCVLTHCIPTSLLFILYLSITNALFVLFSYSACEVIRSLCPCGNGYEIVCTGKILLRSVVTYQSPRVLREAKKGSGGKSKG